MQVFSARTAVHRLHRHIQTDPTKANETETAPDLPLADTGIAPTATQTTRPRRKWYRLVSIPLLVLTFMCGSVVGLYFQPEGLQRFFRDTGLEPGGGTETPIAVAIEKVTAGEEVAVASEGDVVALGRVIPHGDVITVSPPYGAGDARIDGLSVNVGAEVRAGDVLAVFDNLPALESALNTATADLKVKQAR